MQNLENNNLGNQIREIAFLDLNTDTYRRPERLFFVQFDTYHAVANNGISIPQWCD